MDNSTLFGGYVKKHVHNCTGVSWSYNKDTIQDPQRLIKILEQNSCYIIVDPKQHLDCIQWM